MEILTLTLHKTKDTKNKVVYGTKDGSSLSYGLHLMLECNSAMHRPANYAEKGHRRRTRC